MSINEEQLRVNSLNFQSEVLSDNKVDIMRKYGAVRWVGADSSGTSVALTEMETYDGKPYSLSKVFDELELKELTDNDLENLLHDHRMSMAYAIEDYIKTVDSD